jgi:hypothetical protein
MAYHASKPTFSSETSHLPGPEWSPYRPTWHFRSWMLNSEKTLESNDQHHPDPKSSSLSPSPEFIISNKADSKSSSSPGSLSKGPRITILKIKYSIHMICGPSYPPQNLTLTPLDYEYDLYVPPYLNLSICRSYETEQYSKYLTYLIRTFNVKIQNINNWPCVCCHNPGRNFATVQRNCLGFNAFHVSYKPEIINVVVAYCNNEGECEAKANMFVQRYKRHFLKLDGECLDCRTLNILGELTAHGAAR